jgi:hypothetical protein
MQKKLFGPLPLLLVLGVFVLSACSTFQGESSSSQVDLSQTYEIPGFSYSIGYPEGWTVKTRDSYTVITELEKDNPRMFAGADSFEGYAIGFEHRPLEFLINLGLADDADLEQLLAFNSTFFDWQNSDQSEISLFGEPALSVASSEQPGAAIMGFSGDSVYLLTFSAPSDEAWEAFQPTLEAMLDSAQEVAISQ